MADKFSVLIKYKYLEYINNAHLSKSDSWDLIQGVIEYDMTGNEPVFQNPVLYGLFAVIKDDLDKNKEKWLKVSASKSNSGKKGGAPKGNQNASKNNQNNQKQPNACFSEKNNQNNQKQHDSGSGSDLDHEFDLESSEINLSSGGSKHPPQLFELIKNESAAHGFFIKIPEVKEIVKKHENIAWLLPSHSFLEFCANKLQKKYPDKEADQLKHMFISALSDKEKWEDFWDEYPQWRKKQEEKAAEKEHEKAINTALNNPPQKCECGGLLKQFGDRCRCNVCDNIYVFEKNSLKWVLE